MARVVGYDETVKLRCTCKQCGAIVEYIPKEVRRRITYDYGGSSDVVFLIDCPGCGEEIHNVKVK
jgi:RNase P subunit RPR2